VELPLAGTDEVHWFLLSADGKRLAAGTTFARTEEVQLWDVAAGQPVTSREGGTCAAFSPDGKWLAVGGPGRTVRAFGGPGTVTLLDAATGKEVRKLDEGRGEPVVAVAFSPDGKRVAAVRGAPYSGSNPGEIRVWDADTGAEVRTLAVRARPDAGPPFSPDGRFVVGGDVGVGLKVWDLATGKEFPPTGGLDPKELLRWWDRATGATTLPPEVGRGPVIAGAFSADGRLLAKAQAPGTVGVVRVWDTRKGAEVRTLWGHAEAVRCLAFAPDGAWLATGSFDGTVKLWPLPRANP
jgi:WD40 repeat protein